MNFLEEEINLLSHSGGFQVFSLAYGSIQKPLESKGELKMGKDTEEGVIFRSRNLLTSESTFQAQKHIGADISIPLIFRRIIF